VREVEEVNEVNDVEEKNSGVAAFFDLDGTLVALPSLEQRFFRTLRYRREIRARNYFLWLKEAIQLMPRGVNAILQENKMYLNGVKIFDELGEGDGEISSCQKSGHQAEGQASALPSKRGRRNPRLPVPTFFPPAVERVAWHAKQKHEIVLISGTLEPLAREAARALEAELAAHGIIVTIRVIATRLEEADGRWTGRILGEAMFGGAKARAARGLALERRLDLERCFAYGDSLNDRLLMRAVGRSTAVNPSNELVRIARERGWPNLIWEENLTQRHPDRSGQAPSAEKTQKRKNVGERLRRGGLFCRTGDPE
jgi:HAD superfamily phosphoserine phosphatase-like hydrolase